jgi:hypothetical protein
LKLEEEEQQRAILVVDQFEEVFTRSLDEKKRDQFINNLLYASSVPDGRSIVILAMRADFYPKCATHPVLSTKIATHQYIVSPMSRNNLREVIEEPARRVGAQIESTLVEEILDEMDGQPGSLPLLEYALLEVWRRRESESLTMKAYQESGGVKTALARRADAIFESFTLTQQDIVRRVMLRLTQPGEGTDDTRRRATMSELITHAEESALVENVIKELTDARLLTTSGGPHIEARIVDVSHEAIIRGWPRLRRWIEENRAGLRILLRLSESAQEWQRHHFDE